MWVVIVDGAPELRNHGGDSAQNVDTSGGSTALISDKDGQNKALLKRLCDITLRSRRTLSSIREYPHGVAENLHVS